MTESIAIPDHFDVTIAAGDLVEVVDVRERAPQAMHFKGWGYLLTSAVSDDTVSGVWADEFGDRTIDGVVDMPRTRVVRVVSTVEQRAEAARVAEAERQAAIEAAAERKRYRHTARLALHAAGFRRATSTGAVGDGTWAEGWAHPSGMEVTLRYPETPGYGQA